MPRTNRQFKSWVDEKTGPTRSGKWFATITYGVLIAIALIAMGYALWSNNRPTSKLVQISVGDYGADLPPAPFQSWEPFIANGSREQVNSSEAIATTMRTLRLELGKTDNFLLYLRGHALVHEGEAYLLTGNFRAHDFLCNKEERANMAVPMSEVLDGLANLSVQNVVVLADICDLPAVPAAGVVANNVAEALQNDLASRASKTPIWLMTSGASMQPSHRSIKMQKTLMQASIDHALSEASGGVSLADLYETVLRYAHFQSRGTQTPLLFRSGINGMVYNADAWEAAAAVQIAWVETEQAGDAAKSSQEEPPAVASESTGQDIERQEEALSDVDKLASGSDQPSSETEDKEPLESNSEQVAVESPPDGSPSWNNIWWYRDELVDRENNRGSWSPYDFAVVDFKQMQAAAISLELEHRLRVENVQNTESETKEIEAEEVAWKALYHTLAEQDGQPPTGVYHRDLARVLESWDLLQENLEGDKKPWQEPTALRLEEDKWRTLRTSYGIYFESAGMLSNWMMQWLRENSLEHPDFESESIQLPLEKILDSLRNISLKLRESDGSYALDHEFASKEIQSIVTGKNRLREISNLSARVLAEHFRDKQDIRCADEMLFLACLQRIDVGNEVRAQLVQAFENVREQDISSELSEGSLADLLKAADSVGRETVVRRWSENFIKLMELATGRQDLPQLPVTFKNTQGANAQELNDWAAELLLVARGGSITHRDASIDWETAWLKWHKCCFREFFSPDFFQDRTELISDCQGLIVPVSPDTRLWIEPAKHVYELDSRTHSALIQLRIGRNNNAPINEALIVWELPAVEGLTLEPNWPGKRTKNTVLETTSQPQRTRGFRVRIAANEDLRDFANATIRFAVVEPKDFGQTKIPEDAWQTVEVVRILEKLRLIAELGSSRITRAASSTKVAQGNKPRLDLSIDQPLDELRLQVPALGTDEEGKPVALTNYSLRVKNDSKQTKTLQAAIFALEGVGSEADAKSDAIGRALSDANPLFSSPPAILRPGDEAPLKLTASLEEGAQTQPIELGEHGLLCLIQEFETTESNDSVAPRNSDGEDSAAETVLGPQSGRYFFWIKCEATNPVARSWLSPPRQELADEGEPERLRIEEKIGNADIWKFALKTNRQYWEQWNISKFAVEMTLTDDQGDSIVDFPTTGELTTESMQETLEMKAPNELGLLAHLKVGGYPRALSFNSAGRQIQPYSIRIAEVILHGEKADGTKDEDSIETFKDLPTRNAKIVPLLTPEGEYQPELLRIALKTDVPMDAPPTVLSVKFVSANSSRKLEERKFFPGNDRQLLSFCTLDKQGNLAFTATGKDQVVSIDNLKGRLQANGLRSGTLSIEARKGEDGEVCDRRTLVFDQIPPNRSNITIHVSGRPQKLVEIYDTTASIDIRVQASDRQTGISTVMLGIVNETNRIPTFENMGDRKGWKAELIDPDSGLYRKILTVDDLKTEIKLVENSNYVLVAQCIDNAGNIQGQATTARITWRGQPKTGEKTPPKTAQSKPPRQLFTIMVTVTVEGKRPLGEVKLKGPGTAKGGRGGRYQYLRVSPGPFEIKGTYEKFGTTYSGSVSGEVKNGNANVVLDLKPQ